jgi:hypothetical protein
MARRNRDDEQVTDLNLEKVISLLAETKPITKKAACEILRISYNTTRLDSLIENYKRKKAVEAEQRAKKKYKPASPDEVISIITGCLEGEPVSVIAKGLYRSEAFVNGIIDKTGCPKRNSKHTYQSPGILPDSCVKESFNIGEKVFSSRYDSVAEIIGTNKDGVYRIWLVDEAWKQFAYQPWWELGSLKHLETYGVKI